MALPYGAFGKFESFMNDDVEEILTNFISNQSRCTSFELVFWAQRGDVWRRFPDRIGIRYVGIAVENLNGYWMGPTPILYRIAPHKLVFVVQILKKNRAPVRSILRIMMK